MRRLSVLLFACLLSGCGRADAPANGGAPVAPVASNGLTGLYEGPVGGRRNQLCLVERDGRVSFGLIAWGQGDTNCTGWGRAEQAGPTLRLSMDGDPSCVIDARMDGGTIALPERLPEGCAYYCGPGAALAGTRFDRTGGTEADAGRAVDLVGDRLCAGGS